MLSGQQGIVRLLLLWTKRKVPMGRLDPLSGQPAASNPACQDFHAAVMLCIFFYFFWGKRERH